MLVFLTFKRAFLGLWGACLIIYIYIAIYGVWGRGMGCVIGLETIFQVLKNKDFCLLLFTLFFGPLTSLLCMRAGQSLHLRPFPATPAGGPCTGCFTYIIVVFSYLFVLVCLFILLYTGYGAVGWVV